MSSSPTRNNNNPRRLYSRIGSIEESAAPTIANETTTISTETNETTETTSIIESSATNYSDLHLHSSNSYSYTMDEGNTRRSLNAPLSRDEDDDVNFRNNDTDEETATVMEVALSPSLSSTGSSNSNGGSINHNHSNNATKRRFLSLRSSRSNDSGSHENLISSNNGDEEEGRTSKSSSSSFIPPNITSNTNTIPEKYKLNITILDSTQKKFHLIANSQWTTSQLKECGYKIHNVPPFQQRLICMGKLLQDDKRLEEQGLVVNNNNNNNSSGTGHGSVGNGNSVIVHLFPKPNVVIANDNHNDDNCENNTSTNETNSNNDNNNSNNNSGAHVPQIILNRDEVSRVGQILVLSSHEAYETLHRLRLLCFLLLAYCTLQILRDVTIYLAPPDGSNTGMNSGYYLPTDDGIGGGSGSGITGHGNYIPPGDPIDTTSNSPYNDQDTLPQWEDKDYVELIISCFGVYVALLGMKATTDHVGYLAKRFLILLGLLGISWTMFTFYGHFIYNLALEDALSGGNGNDEEGEGGGSSSTGTSSSTNSNVETTMALKVSFMETMVPIFIWLIFYIRAAQFYAMIREAEIEANQRVMNLLPSRSNDSDVSASSSNGGEGGDLELQVEHGTMA